MPSVRIRHLQHTFRKCHGRVQALGCPLVSLVCSVQLHDSCDLSLVSNHRDDFRNDICNVVLQLPGSLAPKAHGPTGTCILNRGIEDDHFAVVEPSSPKLGAVFHAA
jgi:hypothetical protein